MNHFCLGIIGRCLSSQPWTPIPDLYHRQLKIMLEQDGVCLRVSLAGRSDLPPYERMKILCQKKPLNGVLYHMPLIQPDQTLLYSKRDDGGKLSYSLHPYFFKRFFSSKEVYYANDNIDHVFFHYKKNTPDLFEVPPLPFNYRKFLGIRLRNVNFLAGKLCGLNRWVKKNHWDCFEKYRKLCSDLKIPLFVLGPMPVIDTFRSKDKLKDFEKTNKIYQKKLAMLGIPFYFPDRLYDDFGRSLYKKDEIHLNSLGHSFLAKELYPILSNWIKNRDEKH